MYNTTTNLYIFVLVAISLAFELLVTKLVDASVALAWGLTIGLYFLFLLYQLLMKINEDTERNRVKILLYELMDAINGIPIMNKNDKLVIKWDMVFKKLVDHKEFDIYDKLIKIKTQHIDLYVNKYPSLLRDDSVDLRETRHNMDLNSMIKKNKKIEEKLDEELIKDEEYKKTLFIKSIKEDTATFTSYNASLIVDVMLKNEYVPEDAAEKGIPHNPEYDGFSVWMAYQNNKYNVVPRITMHKKLINKSKWLIDNIELLLQCAQEIVNGDGESILYVDNYKLTGYLKDMPKTIEPGTSLKFKQIKNDLLVFSGNDKENKTITVHCQFNTGHNRFEIILKKIEFMDGDNKQIVELEKTVAIGSSFQPLVTLLEKMPTLINNIELVLNNQDINSIVIT